MLARSSRRFKIRLRVADLFEAAIDRPPRQEAKRPLLSPNLTRRNYHPPDMARLASDADPHSVDPAGAQIRVTRRQSLCPYSGLRTKDVGPTK